MLLRRLASALMRRGKKHLMVDIDDPEGPDGGRPSALDYETSLRIGDPEGNRRRQTRYQYVSADTMPRMTPAGALHLSNGGVDDFKVGATLQLDAAQAAGAYTGTFTVTVNYN